MVDTRRCRVFVSYSHQDDELRIALDKHLSPLKRNGLIETWYDGMIEAGRELEDKISNELNRAHIVLLLLSPDFINSDYCYNIEMKHALEQHHEGRKKVVPIILRPCGWLDTPLKVLKAVPKDGMPITDKRWNTRDEACQNIYEEIKNVIAKHIPSENIENLPDIKSKQNADVQLSLKDNLLDQSQSLNIKLLDDIPQYTCFRYPYHFNIRINEQNLFVENLHRTRFTWLMTDWGLNENDFIGSVVDRLALDAKSFPYVLNCEDVSSYEDLILAFDEQFKLSLNKFCDLVNGLDRTLLVLDQVNSNLYTNKSGYNRLTQLVKSILDYSPNIYVVIIARQLPSFFDGSNLVRLSPLDIAQTKQYVSDHPFVEKDIVTPLNIEKLYSLTSGLPRHINRVLNELRFISLEDLLEAEIEPIKIDESKNDSIAKALIRDINSLASSENIYKRRSFQLLKVLTVLANGEAFSNIKRFYPNDPFYTSNITDLEQLFLIEVVPLNSVITHIGMGKESQVIKLLRVPRQVRDFVNDEITEEERVEIIKRSGDIYLGSKWREGEIKEINFSVLAINRTYLNVENIHIITKNILAQAIRGDDKNEIERAAYLGAMYCNQVFYKSNYKNALTASEEIYYLLRTTELKKQKALVLKTYGKSLRMTQENTKAIEILNEAFEYDDTIFSKSEKIELLINLAMVYDTEQKEEKVLEYCDKIFKLNKKRSYETIFSEKLSAKYQLEGDELLNKYKSLEKEARLKKESRLANTISLNIAESENESYENRLLYLSKVMGTDDEYNNVRALVLRAHLYIDNNQIEKISNDDLFLLGLSYTYLYNQNLLGLFEQCHNVIWAYLTQYKKYDELLNLFRFSSFFWRLHDDSEAESFCFSLLNSDENFGIDNIEATHKNQVNINYFIRRRDELVGQL